MTNTQVLLTRKDDGLPLVVDELIGVSSLKAVDELNEVEVTALAMVLGAQEVRQLTLALDVVDADLALHQLLHETLIPQRDMLCAKNIGMVAGDVQRQRVIDMQRHAAKAFTEAQLRHHVGAVIPPPPSLSEPSPRALPPSWAVRSAPVVPI